MAHPSIDLFSFDDLMVSCAQEIISNGMETTNIPDEIKGWISRKIVTSLPQQLIKRLLTYLLDNRELSDSIGFREKNTGDIPEFTLLMYRTAKMKHRLEKENKFKENIQNDVYSDPYNHEKLLPPKTTTTPESSMFLAEKNLTLPNEQAHEFFADNYIIDHTQPIFKTEKLRNNDFYVNADDLRQKYGCSSPEPAIMDNNNEVVDIRIDSDEDSSGIVRKRLRVVKTVRRGARYDNAKCKLCPAVYARKSRLKEHLKKKHPEWWAENEENYEELYKHKSLVKRTSTDGSKPEPKPSCCSKCELCHQEFKYFKEKVSHQQLLHPEYHENRCQNEPQYARMANRNMNCEKAEQDPDIIRIEVETFGENGESNGPKLLWKCLLCEKKSKHAHDLVNHVNSKHRKLTASVCGVCGKEFNWKKSLIKHMMIHNGMPYPCRICEKQFPTRHRLVDEHTKTHHPVEYEMLKHMTGEELRFKEPVVEEMEEKWDNTTTNSTMMNYSDVKLI